MMDTIERLIERLLALEPMLTATCGWSIEERALPREAADTLAQLLRQRDGQREETMRAYGEADRLREALEKIAENALADTDREIVRACTGD
jgi:hypothetical protein